MSLEWFVAQTRAGGERLAKLNLLRQQFDAFLPQIRKETRRRGRTVKSLQPLFPGYIFVRFDHLAENWRPIHSTLGVRRLIMKELGRPASVPPSFMDRLQKHCSGEIYSSPASLFTPGQTVLIEDGPFESQFAEVESLSGANRVQVLLHLLGQKVSLTVEPGQLRAA
ncbi:transcription termination/antitermination protein NusG [Qipengyuania flava]|uniref:transcription termination/antitermination protein NusG n=1 Tax=Qipengyuania flava TaxID=192812 RepID=UPI0012FE31E6|nr:transcriptional activator RfaH [Qipengyuania flava]